MTSPLRTHSEGGKTAWFRVARGDSPAVADDTALRRRVAGPRREAQP